MDKTEAYLRVSDEIKVNEDIHKLVYLMEKTHTETYMHSLHVALLMACLCDELSLDISKTSLLIQSALIHDIGKMSIDINILDKKGALTTKDRKEIERHPRLGYKTAKRMKFSKDICKRILLHHWRPNKEGYPKLALYDEDLINDIELLAMCDMYSAIVQPRSYHAPYSIKYALSEIGREQFDVKNFVAFKKTVLKHGDICFMTPPQTR